MMQSNMNAKVCNKCNTAKMHNRAAQGADTSVRVNEQERSKVTAVCQGAVALAGCGGVTTSCF